MIRFGHYLIITYILFLSCQILILDKDNFETNPVNSLAEIQTFLEIKEQFDYERILKCV